MITKYRYDQNLVAIVPAQFDRETEHYLFRGETKISKRGSYAQDWYDTYKECHEAALNMLQQDIAEITGIVKLRRERLANFKARVPKQ